MNKILIALALIFMAGTAQASMVESYTANLKTFDFEPGSLLASANVTSGTVDVEPISNITLTLFRSVKCNTGFACPRIAYAPIVYQVRVKKVSTGNCGERVYTGSSDDGSQNSITTKVTVIDNTHNTCKYTMIVPATEVKLMIEGGEQNLQEYHSMTADRLNERM